MYSDFTIIHRRKPHVFAASEFPLWSTCLRSLAFVSPEALQVREGDEIYSHTEAYRFLLEIICGLHSPIAGETEVFGQFKTFAQTWILAEPKRKPLVQSLLNDAKAIRTRHLSGFGTQSYGGWVRKNLTDGKIHVIGGGILAREILPYLQKQEREVVLHVRDPRKVDFFTGEIHALSEGRFDHGALLIAAPIEAADAQAWLQGAVPSQLFDLRETSDRDPVQAREVFPLHEVFAQIAATKSRLQPVLENVRQEINGRAEKMLDRSILRPLGWDDLCA